MTGPPRPAVDDAALDLELGGRSVRITHPRRVIWPATGTDKLTLVDYLVEIAPLMLPYLRRRPTMLWRFPEGIDGPGWFQAQCRSRPPWVATHDVIGRRGDLLRYCVIDEAATLAWLANLGTIELHPHGWTVDRPDEPSAIVVDLDPGPPAGLHEAAVAARIVADRLRSSGLEPVVKTSGRAGLHVAATLGSGETFERVKATSRSIAEELAGAHPELMIARNDRADRAGRVYVDWIQNDRNRQLIAPYSPRATPIPTVSMPLTWDEVEAAADGDVSALRPSFRSMLRRVERLGDLWLGGTEASRPVASLPLER